MPPFLYKYESLTTQSLENLKNQVIYFGSPANFNDPDDCANPDLIKPTDDEIEAFRQGYCRGQSLWAKPEPR